VPETVKHGEDLVCSFPTCRNAGVKFRYCVYCKAPVAKRNFVKRHNLEHGEGSARVDIGKVDNDVKSKQSSPRDSLTGRTKNRSKKNSAATITDSSFRSARRSSDNNKSDRSSLPAMQEKISARKNSSHAPPAASSEMDVLKPKDVRMQQWAHLLETRPDTMDETGMSIWVDEVMAVSDLKKPLVPKLTAPFPFSSRRDNKSKPPKKRKRAEFSSTKENVDARHSKKQPPKKAPQTSSSLIRIPMMQSASLLEASHNPDTHQVLSDSTKSETYSSKSESDGRMSPPSRDSGARGASSLNYSSSETQDKSETVTNSSNGSHREMSVRQVRFMKGKLPEEAFMLSNTSDEIYESEAVANGTANFKMTHV
jgi:hypothetical protein